MKNNISEESRKKICAGNFKGLQTKLKNRQIKEKEYYNAPIKCLECDNPIPYDKRLKNKFCSQSCMAKHNNSLRGEKRFCKECGKELNRAEGQKIFCSRKCNRLFLTNEKIKKWKEGEWDGLTPSKKFLSETVRNFLLKESNYSCEECGWNKINTKLGFSPLQIHHKDGNYKNNKRDNLQVLCPNCHSLTNNFGSLNNGNGREYRYG